MKGQPGLPAPARAGTAPSGVLRRQKNVEKQTTPGVIAKGAVASSVRVRNDGGSFMSPSGQVELDGSIRNNGSAYFEGKTAR